MTKAKKREFWMTVFAIVVASVIIFFGKILYAQVAQQA
jgi:hypothetical protein